VQHNEASRRGEGLGTSTSYAKMDEQKWEYFIVCSCFDEFGLDWWLL
jgi:hypothetical protein